MAKLHSPHPPAMEKYFRHDKSRHTAALAQTALCHNSLAAFTYFGLFLAMFVQIFTGLAMFAASSNAFYAPYFEKLLIGSGGFFPIRNIHHIFLWVFVLFTIVHIYLVFYHDYIERNGIASSIIGGWKFADNRLVKEMVAEERKERSIQIKKLKASRLKRQQIKQERRCR